MLKPAGFDPTKKYPVLFCNYGGPGSQQVANRFGTVSTWHQMLAQKGFIVVSFDNTGTGFRGEEFKKKTYLQLGKYEIEDQIDAAKYLGTLPYVDKDKIGHWGWSFGGFMSSLAITKGADVFSAAIAVAPVTNWRFYDNIYTERYMRTPAENPKGYDDNSPVFFTDKIKGKYLLIHGTADDNVHFQNSTQMVSALVKSNIDFESAAKVVGAEQAAELRNLTIRLYDTAADFAAERGIILADTKFEFGINMAGEITLGDEALTPDSSRFWEADGWAPGKSQPSFDKQFVRDWLTSSGWDKESTPPELPAEIVEKTAARYEQAYERITGSKF